MDDISDLEDEDEDDEDDSEDEEDGDENFSDVDDLDGTFSFIYAFPLRFVFFFDSLIFTSPSTHPLLILIIHNTMHLSLFTFSHSHVITSSLSIRANTHVPISYSILSNNLNFSLIHLHRRWRSPPF